MGADRIGQIRNWFKEKNNFWSVPARPELPREVATAAATPAASDGRKH
jgi:hypothetical protein